LGFGKFNVCSVEVASSDNENSEASGDRQPEAPAEKAG